ncbi:hypothetical protein F4821DRAFT_243118 [Hypoxylon rubiginosum]|uniref:Uncharacterized protein n=1 Tax=Hypoxylon rubiginosum TaxID=110542 RepID=A0ACC0CW05_9PEZI|nr:hypothetical protein F4821DRAFT_243118 [Hypoxylon rubiginosum]
MALARKPSAHWFMCGAELISDNQLRLFQIFLELFRGPNLPYIDIHDRREDRILRWLSNPSLFNVPTEDAVRLVQKQIDRSREGCLVECICFSAFGASATNPRDFVYALIGMVPNRVQPDYNKSTRDVYIDAILSDGIVECLPFLLMLSGLGYAYENDHNLPSWLPDFSKLSKFGIDYFTKIGGRRPSFLPPTVELQPPEIAQRDVLRIQGVAYDRVKLVNKPQALEVDEPFLGRYLRRICVEYLEELSGFDSIESEDEGFRWCLVNKPLETLMDVLSCGDFPKDDCVTIISPANTSLPKHATVFLLNYLFAGIPFTEDEETTAVGWPVIQPNLPLDPILAAALVGHKIWDVVDVLASPSPEIRYVDATKLVDFSTSIDQAATSKALFKTDKGQLGIGPPNIKAGDVVCALDQSQFPSLLRRAGSHWEHVGACYVKELPSVDAAEVFKTEQMKVETFDIY